MSWGFYVSCSCCAVFILSLFKLLYVSLSHSSAPWTAPGPLCWSCPCRLKRGLHIWWNDLGWNETKELSGMFAVPVSSLCFIWKCSNNLAALVSVLNLYHVGVWILSWQLRLWGRNVGRWSSLMEKDFTMMKIRAAVWGQTTKTVANINEKLYVEASY